MPGLILSKDKYWDKMQQQNPAKVKKFIKKRCSIGRFGRPDEIAPFAVMLASEQAAFAAGSLISIDGGIM
jgi:NAD(P)-dependent dehydrogenase (short-subunit alcohol dehydrogenase family)